MYTFKFYFNWLKFIAIAFIGTGVYIAFFSQSEYFLFKIFLDNHFWKDGIEPDLATSNFQGFMYGLCGAVIAAWSTLMLFVLHYGFKQKKKWAWNALLTSVIVWFPIDEFFSLYYKVYFNAIFNAIFVVLFIIPLMLSSKHFRDKL